MELVRPLQGVLLDTHVLLWILRGADNVGARLRRIIDKDAPLYFSTVSLVELAIKAQRGKIIPPPNLSQTLESLGFRELSLDSRAAEAISRFGALADHDPFDRMLVAQAASNSVVLETADDTLLALELPHVRDARL